jgi:hypothetical protein
MLFLLLILFLGVCVPFWMEYKSRINPLPTRDSDRFRGPELQDRHAYYCPACGGKIHLPAWQTEPQQEVPMAPLSLQTLTEPTWQTAGREMQRAPMSTNRTDIISPSQ